MVSVLQLRLSDSYQVISFADVFEHADRFLTPTWRETLERELDALMSERRHGKLGAWLEALEALPALTPGSVNLNEPTITLGDADECTDEERARIESQLFALSPWRKGPYSCFGTHIDTEWRSDWKWDRVRPHIQPLDGRVVLDIGCGSGYHCWRMLGEGARYVLGVDPSQLFMMQFRMMKHFAGPHPIDIVPLGIEHLPRTQPAFDTVFSMGVLYHRRSPIDHLLELRDFLKPGGELVLETLVIEDQDGMTLVPRDRYAQMRNVWFIPSCPTMETWLHRAGFTNIALRDISQTTTDEQRSTPWMTYQSLGDFLDPKNRTKTIEGYQAPIRATWTAERPA